MYLYSTRVLARLVQVQSNTATIDVSNVLFSCKSMWVRYLPALFLPRPVRLSQSSIRPKLAALAHPSAISLTYPVPRVALPYYGITLLIFLLGVLVVCLLL
jgi:hypothetical protein